MLSAEQLRRHYHDMAPRAIVPFIDPEEELHPFPGSIICYMERDFVVQIQCVNGDVFSPLIDEPFEVTMSISAVAVKGIVCGTVDGTKYRYCNHPKFREFLFLFLCL